MGVCNLFSGSGFETSLMGPWSKALLGLGILFFLIALLKKWVFEGMELPFNLILAEIAGCIGYIVAANLLCSSKLALVIGLAAGLVIGYFGGNIIGSDE